MENKGEWEQKNLMNELLQGSSLARQLQIHLNVPSSHETRELLVEKILRSYEKAFSMLNWSGSMGGDQPQPAGFGIRISESLPAPSESPHSEESDHKDASKKRKTLPRWTQQVRVSPGTGLEGPLDDGFSWSKYGQKDILGAKHPRGYYRCTNRNAQGCLATKQVQRSDEDPTIFEITYRGWHTCTQASHSIPPPASPGKQDPSDGIAPHQPQQNQQQSQEMLLNLRTGLKVITEGLDTREQAFPSFHNPSASYTNIEKYHFSPSMVESNFMGKFSPSFISPAAVSPSGMNSFGANQNLHSPESELTEIISAATSTSNSPAVGMDSTFGPVEFDPNFTFDNPGFFS